jgi:hypothetical protein
VSGLVGEMDENWRLAFDALEAVYDGGAVDGETAVAVLCMAISLILVRDFADPQAVVKEAEACGRYIAVCAVGEKARQ